MTFTVLTRVTATVEAPAATVADDENKDDGDDVPRADRCFPNHDTSTMRGTTHFLTV